MGKNKPSHEIKLGGIRATIWENATDDRDSWFNVALSRRYRSGEEWKETSTFRRDDLPVAMMALDMAYRWVWRKQKQDAAATSTNRVSARTRR